MERYISDDFMSEVCEMWGAAWDVERQRVVDPITRKDLFETYENHRGRKRLNEDYENMTPEEIEKKKKNREYFQGWYQLNKEKLKQKRQEKKKNDRTTKSNGTV